MDMSKFFQQELSYEGSLGKVNINTYTGRLLFKMLDINFNVESYNLNVMHIYNSKYTYPGFRGQPFGKKWKLSCEQFLYLENEQYVYHDENGMYIYFEHLTDNKYYDTSGFNYILTVYDDYQELKDSSGKIRKFEDCKLKEVYYEGGSSKKIIEYNVKFITRIYDTSNPEDRIEFSYSSDGLLKEISISSTLENTYTLKYFYNNQELIKINKSLNGVEKTIALFEYDSNKIKYIISLYDNTGFKIEYSSEKVTKISNIEVTISETKQTCRKRIGELNEFVGEDVYLGDYEILTQKTFDDSTNNYNVLSYDNLEYITNGLTIQNNIGLKQVLYYDDLGKPTSSFEYVTDLTDLKVPNINYGLSMLKGGGYSDKINSRMGIEVTETDNSVKNKNTTFFNNFKTLLNNKYRYNGGVINQLVCSFYIKLLAPITSNIITILFEYESYTKSAYSFIDSNLVGVWQHISIPITIDGYEFTDVKILGLQGEEKIYLNYMKLNAAPESKINIIYNGIKVNLKDAIGIMYLDENNIVSNITFSKDNYLSIMDLLNMKFYKIINNTNEKLLSYNNGQKKLIINNAILRLDNKDNKYDVDSIEIDNLDFNIEQKNLFNTQEIITNYSLYDDTNIIEETTYKDLNDESNSKTYYKKYDFNFTLLSEGDTLLETDEDLFSLTTPYRIVVYKYDKNKNLKSKAIQWPCSFGGNEVKEEKTFNNNSISIVETHRKYYSEDKTTKTNSITNSHYGNDNVLLKVEKNYEVDADTIIDAINYKYDYYNENVIEVNNNQDKHNYVLYNNKGLPFYYSSNNINSNDQSKFYYSFEYEDEGNLKIQRVYLNSYTSNFNSPSKTLLFTNTYDRINNTIEIVRKDNNNNNSKKYKYDKYDRITEVLVNGESKAQFQYDDDDYELEENIKISYTNVYDKDLDVTEKYEAVTQGLNAKYTYYPLNSSEVSDDLSEYKNCGYLLTKKSDNVRIIYGDSQIGFNKDQFKDVNLDNSSEYKEIGYNHLYSEVVYKDNSSSDAKLLAMEGSFRNNLVYINEYEYDPISRLKKKIIKNKNYDVNNPNYNIINESYEYYDFSNRLKQLYASGNIEGLEDNVCLLSSELTYDELGRIVESDIYGYDSISHFKYKYQYDNNDQLIKEEVSQEVSSVESNQSREYSYSENGSILEEKIYENSILHETKTFQYDGAKLKEVNCTLNNNSGTEKTLMSYDEYGNCTEIKEYSLLGQKEDLIKHTTLNWNDGKLVEYVNDDINISYKYNNINGTRYIKTIQKGSETKTIKYYYDGNKLIKEERENYNISYFYDERGVAGLTIYNDDEKDTYYFLRNYDNSIVGIVDETNLIVAEYSYSAYGECTMHYVNDVFMNDDSIDEDKKPFMHDGEFIGDINPFRYKGYYYDVETNLFLVSSRYYSPELCRWISPDDIEYLDPESVNGLNLYCYCLNNPIMYVDPDGHSPKWWQWALSGAALVGGAILCFIPGGQGLGVSLLVAGGSMMASNIMDAAGVDGKTASLISSGLNIVGGIALCFTPFAGIGANMIGSGIGGIAGGYISEALGGSFELGAAIGNIVGGIAGGKVYDYAKFSRIAKQGILIGKMGQFEAAAASRNLAYYNGMPGYNTVAKISPGIASKLGWANNHHYISNVMKHGGMIYNLGGPATGSYGKELALIANYLWVINL